MVNWFYKMEAGVFPARQPKLEGWILDFKSSPFLYVLGFCVVGFIIVQSVFFLVRAWRRGKQLGMTTATLKNTVVSSALFTIAPALAIVATVLTLSKALGLVLPWIRLTVIGAIQYEVPAAEAAINAFGISTGLSQPVTDPEVFAAVAWVMTIGSILPLVIVPFALKKIQKSIGKVSTKDPKWADTMAAAAFIGLIAAFIGRAVLGKGPAGRDRRRRRNPERCNAFICHSFYAGFAEALHKVHPEMAGAFCYACEHVCGYGHGDAAGKCAAAGYRFSGMERLGSI